MVSRYGVFHRKNRAGFSFVIHSNILGRREPGVEIRERDRRPGVEVERGRRGVDVETAANVLVLLPRPSEAGLFLEREGKLSGVDQIEGVILSGSWAVPVDSLRGRFGSRLWGSCLVTS